MTWILRKNYSLVVMDSSDEKKFNEVIGIVGCVLYPNGGKFRYRVLDENHPTMRVIDIRASKKDYSYIQELLERYYPGLCVYNAA